MNIKSVVVITLLWTVLGAFIALYNDALLSSPFFSLGFPDIYDFKVHLMMNLLISFLGGVFGGTVLVIINSKLFRKRSFRFALITTAYSYSLLFSSLLLVFTLIRATIKLGDNFSFNGLVELSYDMVMNYTVVTNYFLWGGVTLLTLFLLQVNDKFGQGILLKFILGKYFHPKIENRVFMFLDMKSSTTIAEQLGNEKYFRLLRDLFSHLTEPILNNGGEIYQYVGDEIVISWPLEKGIENNNCLKCFFQIQEKLFDLESYYKNKYGVMPSFKAGLHHGDVMAGEIGVIKKDIIYSGDVLNTAARIQAKCNEYNVDFLISEETLNLIKNNHRYECRALGSIELRGKKKMISINSLSIKK